MPRWTGFAGKSLWDWLQLLVIPLALAAIAFGLNYLADERDLRREDQRAALERSIASERRREDVLDAYLQQMSEMIFERRLLIAPEGSESRAIAGTLTLGVLRRLDGIRKGFVLQFLAEAGLIGGRDPKISLGDADLRRVRINGFLGNAVIGSADLREADFRGSDLYSVSFEHSRLQRADFSGAFVSNASFGAAELRGAKFNGANVSETTFEDACLIEASFRRAALEDTDFGIASGRDVDFSGAALDNVDLRGSELVRLNLTGARLRNSSGPYTGQDSTRTDPNCRAHG
jgi:Pentapeptide repeats (9 copies)/Pentapeptide repeats (8 copies)